MARGMSRKVSRKMKGGLQSRLSSEDRAWGLQRMGGQAGWQREYNIDYNHWYPRFIAAGWSQEKAKSTADSQASTRAEQRLRSLVLQKYAEEATARAAAAAAEKARVCKPCPASCMAPARGGGENSMSVDNFNVAIRNAKKAANAASANIAIMNASAAQASAAIESSLVSNPMASAAVGGAVTSVVKPLTPAQKAAKAKLDAAAHLAKTKALAKSVKKAIKMPPSPAKTKATQVFTKVAEKAGIAAKSHSIATKRVAVAAKKAPGQRGGGGNAQAAQAHNASVKHETAMDSLHAALSEAAEIEAAANPVAPMAGGWRMYGGANAEHEEFDKALEMANSVVASAPMAGGQGEAVAPHQQAVIDAADAAVASAEAAAAAANSAAQAMNASAPSMGGRRRGTMRGRRGSRRH